MAKKKCLDINRMWIDGKCHNIPIFDPKKYDCRKTSNNAKQFQETELKTSKIFLPSIYYLKLAQYKNPLVNIIQNDTNTNIKYPRHGLDGFLEISGESEESVEEAKMELYSFFAETRRKLSALQFVAIPLLSDEIKRNFSTLKKEILTKNYQGVEESIFQSSSKLHLTIAVFTLFSIQEKEEAVKVLDEIKNDFQKLEKPIRIRVQGLNCMNPDYSKVNVLYADASLTNDSGGNESLQTIANTIFNSYYERGLCRDHSDNVKLHMTVMNTKYRKRKEGTPKKRWVKRETFDASQIMEEFRDFHFGEAELDKIHLSLMSSQGDDGFYKSLACIKL